MCRHVQRQCKVRGMGKMCAWAPASPSLSPPRVPINSHILTNNTHDALHAQTVKLTLAWLLKVPCEECTTSSYPNPLDTSSEILQVPLALAVQILNSSPHFQWHLGVECPNTLPQLGAGHRVPVPVLAVPGCSLRLLQPPSAPPVAFPPDSLSFPSFF